MKVLFDHPDPFLLAHGGFQIQIEQTKAALETIGVQVEFLRWWDGKQTGELIHYFGRPPLWQIEFAHRKGIKFVLAQLLTGAGSRSSAKLFTQKLSIAAARRLLPATMTAAFNWESFRRADACVALTPWEAHLMSHLFCAPREKIHIISNGVEEIFLNSPAAPRGPWLVCTATITERKRVLELAQAAVQAETPLRVIGKPYAESDPYAQKFLQLAREQPQWIRYEGAVSDRARLAAAYREARGFVLLSTMESLSLSALEAAAGECPLLLSDLPWARTVFGDHAAYCPIASVSATAGYLRRFYDAAPGLPRPPKPPTWNEVAQRLKELYDELVGKS